MDQSMWASNEADKSQTGSSAQSAFGNTNSGAMAICQFFQRGTCRFGERCRDEHPGTTTNANRFGAPRGGGDSYRPGQQSGGSFGGTPARTGFSIDKSDIKADLTGQRPIYPLSCYGPGREAPRQLIEGLLEVSPEELRYRYYQYRAAGNEAAAQQEEIALHAQMKQQIDRILGDLDGAAKYIEEGANVHPNRIDVAQGKAPLSSLPGSSSTPLLQQPMNAAGAGPQPPALGQSSASSFGLARPATATFGQAGIPNQTATAFGQASQPAQSAFGRPAAMGAAGGASFGTPSLPGANPFGQASSLGAAASPFGNSSGQAAGSGFGQPSAPGAASASAWGKSSVPVQPSAFGQSNVLGQGTALANPAFGTTSFGQPSLPGAPAGTTPFGQQAGQASPFGQQQSQPTAQASPFGQQPPQAGNPFGTQPQTQAQAKPNPFATAGAPQAPAFGTAGLANPSPSPFAQAPAQQPAAAATNPFGQKPQGLAATPTTLFGQAPSMVAQQPQAQSAAGSMPIAAKDRFKEGRPEEYEGDQGKALEETYRRVGTTGTFEDDEDVPTVPPKCEWIVPMEQPL